MTLRRIFAGSASVLVLAALAAPTLADDTVETVVVTGIRASLQRSIDIKHDTVSIVDAVSAEDIGKFPDKNVADALQRVPGVNTVSAASGEGGFGENDRVSIRGTNASLTQTTVDGHAIANGDWFILDQFQTIGRSVSYTLLPSEIVDTLKIYKSQQADMTEGGVAGVVDIITRKPLDFKDGLTIEGSAEAAYNTLRGSPTPQLNALFGYKDSSGKFGVMFQAFYEEMNIRRDGQEFLGYSQISPTSTLATAHPDLANAYYPTLIGSALFMQQRARKGGELTVQVQPSSGFELTLSGFYSHLNAGNINNNYMFWGTNEFGSGNSNQPTSYKTVTGSSGEKTIVAATFPSAGGTPIVADSIGRPGSGAETYFLNADASWNATNTLTFSFKGGMSHGVGKTDPQVAWEGEVQGAPGGTTGYDFSSGVAAVSVPGVNTANPATLVNDWAWTVVNTAVDREYYGQIDAEQQLNIGPLQSVKGGFRFAEHKRTSIVWDGGVSYGGSTGTDISNSNYPSDFADSFKIPGMLTDVPLGNTAMMEKFMFNPSNTSWRSYPQTPDAVSNPKNGRFDWQLSLNVAEQDWAGYAMANIGGDHWKGNFGVRVVETTEDIHQYVNNPNGTYSDFGSYGIDQIKHHYWDILPSANISVNIGDESVVHFAAAETMSRPDYSALAGSVQLTDLNLTGNGGNPNLKPIRSANYNLSYEWYYGPQSLVSVGVFYMDLSSYVSFGTSQASYVNMTLTGKSTTPVYSLYSISSPYNSSGHDEGIEVDWEQPVWGGFGVQTNFTYANGVDNGGGPLVGDSKVVANLTGYYENSWLSARFTYMYRSKMLLGLDRSSAENQNAYGTLNASVQFTVTDNLILTFEGQNLTNRLLRYYAADITQPRAIYDNGSMLYAGIRFKY